MAHVMIIEDEPTIAMVLQELLVDEGYEVSKACHGLEGLHMLQESRKPDIVLVDLNMPVLNGRGVVEAMRSDDHLRDIPVIIVTGTVYNTYDFPPEGTYQDILQKPFDLNIMLDKVGQLVDVS